MGKNKSQLIYCTKILIIQIVSTFIIMLAMGAWAEDNNNLSLSKFYKNWKKNVKKKPVWDKDIWLFNYLAHPYCGAIYYMIPKSNNFSNRYSFAYSVFVSTVLWEYGIEAFMEVPSIQDLIITPISGYFIGKKFNRITKKIILNNNRLMNSKKMGKLAIFLMNPVNTLAKKIKSNKVI